MDQNSLFNVYSIRKTYVCLAMAIAIIKEKVPAATPVYELIDDLGKDELGKITISDLCTGTGPKYFGDEGIERGATK